MDAGILNVGLGFAMAFGAHWMEPTQARLSVVHPELSKEDLDRYDAIARQAMKQGHDLVPACFRAASGVQKTAYLIFEKQLREEYPWISDEMSSRLFSQGLYYAWKDGNMP